jgi:hypothetical protein
MRGSLRYALRASVEMTTLCKGQVGRRQEQKKKQIPFGNDRKKSNGNGSSGLRRGLYRVLLF